jgi:hypothetical protein
MKVIEAYAIDTYYYYYYYYYYRSLCYRFDPELRLSKLMLSILVNDRRSLCYRFVVSCFELGADATRFFLFINLNITIKTSTLDYNGDRYLSSIINCVIFRL